MTKNEMMMSVSRTFNKFGLKLKKHSPEIMVVAGVAGTVVSTVLACKATTKVSGILEKAKKDISDVHAVLEDPNVTEAEYSVEDSKKDLTIIYAQTGLQLAKTYAPAAIVGALSITSILAGHNMLRKRNVALAAAYATVDSGFKEYRNRVVERFGKELDRELKYNLKTKEVEEVVKNEDGTEQVVKKTVTTATINPGSDYSRFFDETCTGWTKDPEYNLSFLNGVQNFANEKLKAKGYLFLNDVYDMLGLQRSKAGQHVGWIYDENNPIGDNYIDFGIWDVRDETKRAFVNGYERSILLDFNVDGDILDKF